MCVHARYGMSTGVVCCVMVFVLCNCLNLNGERTVLCVCDGVVQWRMRMDGEVQWTIVKIKKRLLFYLYLFPS
jgi:hypothetical protein